MTRTTDDAPAARLARSAGTTPEFTAALGRIAERAADHDRDGTFPHEGFADLHATGALNVTLPTGSGGGGAGLAQVVPVVRAVGAADPSVALVLAMHLLNHVDLREPGNPWPRHVRREVQRSSLGGVALINALRVEPDLGTPARGGLPATTAERTADGWALRGHKTYSTGIPGLRWLLVWARTDEPEPRVGAFLVPREAGNYRIERTWNHLGMRGTRSDDVLFEGTRIPAEHAVDLHRPDAPGRNAGVLGTWSPVVLSALYDGVARAARDWLVGYLNERTPANLGKPLASLPRFQQAVGRIETLLLSNASLLDSAARAVDEGEQSAGQAGLAKHAVTTNAIRAVELGIELIGNPGLSRNNPIERHYRNVLCSRIHTPQDDTALTAAGTAALTV
ncbi:acyl-CoA/acyl-ACP dehydrogenase [Saccharopolyspora sp. NFXS83]|uniref:acyl-CoA dehydrogenase family protein n=1 Tax=Saccharopolyspora sp. NFXS83 TaxID=2993560 RepID=UPI00224A9DB3|nr:acyl-CoA dehydrogenase family protein [Saccharopolyspora sp. NFXS83]MCX2729954.1 acyl-CoA/acyl-ACP dehydrogenase [Saccharopolyspora sp. NFXS83]